MEALAKAVQEEASGAHTSREQRILRARQVRRCAAFAPSCLPARSQGHASPTAFQHATATTRCASRHVLRYSMPEDLSA